LGTNIEAMSAEGTNRDGIRLIDRLAHELRRIGAHSALCREWPPRPSPCPQKRISEPMAAPETGIRNSV